MYLFVSCVCVCTYTFANNRTHTPFARTLRQAKYRGCVSEKEELSWVLKQDNDFYYSIVVKEMKKKAKSVERVMSRDLQLKPKQYQHMLNVVQWLEKNGDLYKRFVTHGLRRINKNQYPSTLTHGDLRGENILFPQEHMKEFMLFDFQLMKEVNGVNDIAYLITSSMSVKERRIHEKNLLIQYYNEMKRRGASDLTWEEILFSYMYVSPSLASLYHLKLTNKYIHTQPGAYCHGSHKHICCG